ncbi:GNAT family N-acetyltransferase [Anaerococcus porci]|uniref:GNAT family N-acetyltransferase n=1 Tax=Anaerococcus porci TaxID=2652269 RepID=UPI002A749B5B|nr:GNAT family N-acetyltransferase [Anaerococcus porci]MDY3005660.1 GNAT family N-acetyltransferase [Anaerococcus porci]
MNPDINITGIRLETNSLILRPFKKDDLKDFNEYAKIPGVGEMAGRTHHESIEESSKILDMFINGKKTFAIIKKETGKVIGSFGIEKYKEELVGEKYKNLKCREIGYVLSKNFWGKGYMTEAGHAILEYCFDTLELDAVFCGYFKKNTQSKRVSEKLGFNYLLEHFFYTKYGTKEQAILTVIHNSQRRKQL